MKQKCCDILLILMGECCVSNSGSPDEQSPGEVDAVGDAAMDAFEQLPGISYRIKNLLLIYRDLRSPALEKMQ